MIVFWKQSVSFLVRDKTTMAALSLLCVIVLLAFLLPVLSPYAYYDTHLLQKNLPPCHSFWFGTDDLGRDLFTRTWKGARISLLIACSASAIDLVFGVFVGTLAAFKGGIIDKILMKTADILYSIPYLVATILWTVVLGPSLPCLILAFTLTGWISMARIVRAQILQIKQRTFVLAALALGASPSRLFLTHLIPHATSQILTTLLLTMASFLFAEAFLSFLGLGVQPPLASLGSLLNESLPTLRIHPWRALFPASLLVLTLLCLSLIAEGLRKALNQQKHREGL